MSRTASIQQHPLKSKVSIEEKLSVIIWWPWISAQNSIWLGHFTKSQSSKTDGGKAMDVLRLLIGRWVGDSVSWKVSWEETGG